MTSLYCLTSPSIPYSDGDRVLFEITDGAEHVPCAISRLALEVLVGARCFKSKQLLAGFAKAQDRIEAFAATKLHARPDGVFGRLNLWADDVDEPPPGCAPDVAQSISIQLESA